MYICTQYNNYITETGRAWPCTSMDAVELFFDSMQIMLCMLTIKRHALPV